MSSIISNALTQVYSETYRKAQKAYDNRNFQKCVDIFIVNRNICSQALQNIVREIFSNEFRARGSSPRSLATKLLSLFKLEELKSEVNRPSNQQILDLIPYEKKEKTQSSSETSLIKFVDNSKSLIGLNLKDQLNSDLEPLRSVIYAVLGHQKWNSTDNKTIPPMQPPFERELPINSMGQFEIDLSPETFNSFWPRIFSHYGNSQVPLDKPEIKSLLEKAFNDIKAKVEKNASDEKKEKILDRLREEATRKRLIEKAEKEGKILEKLPGPQFMRDGDSYSQTIDRLFPPKIRKPELSTALIVSVKDAADTKAVEKPLEIVPLNLRDQLDCDLFSLRQILSKTFVKRIQTDAKTIPPILPPIEKEFPVNSDGQFEMDLSPDTSENFWERILTYFKLPSIPSDNPKLKAEFNQVFNEFKTKVEKKVASERKYKILDRLNEEEVRKRLIEKERKEGKILEKLSGPQFMREDESYSQAVERLFPRKSTATSLSSLVLKVNETSSTVSSPLAICHSSNNSENRLAIEYKKEEPNLSTERTESSIIEIESDTSDPSSTTKSSSTASSVYSAPDIEFYLSKPSSIFSSESSSKNIEDYLSNSSSISESEKVEREIAAYLAQSSFIDTTESKKDLEMDVVSTNLVSLNSAMQKSMELHSPLAMLLDDFIEAKETGYLKYPEILKNIELFNYQQMERLCDFCIIKNKKMLETIYDRLPDGNIRDLVLKYHKDCSALSDIGVESVYSMLYESSLLAKDIYDQIRVLLSVTNKISPKESPKELINHLEKIHSFIRSINKEDFDWGKILCLLCDHPDPRNIEAIINSAPVDKIISKREVVSIKEDIVALFTKDLIKIKSNEDESDDEDDQASYIENPEENLIPVILQGIVNDLELAGFAIE